MYAHNGQAAGKAKCGGRETHRSEAICRRNTKARRVAITGVNPTQNYGFTGVGMAPRASIRPRPIPQEPWALWRLGLARPQCCDGSSEQDALDLNRRTHGFASRPNRSIHGQGSGTAPAKQCERGFVQHGLKRTRNSASLNPGGSA